jgi:hypothetical protein
MKKKEEEDANAEKKWKNDKKKDDV